MNPIDNAIKEMVNYQLLTEKTIKDMVEKNAMLTKTIATVRSILERAIKNPNTLNSSIYESVDLCRANLVYLDYSSGKNKKDPPLSDGEKTLPEHNGNQNTNR